MHPCQARANQRLYAPWRGCPGATARESAGIITAMDAPVRYSFGDFVLDVAERSLTRRGSSADQSQGAERVSLQPKTFDLLVHLVSHAGKLHTKQALLDQVWGKVVVTENSLTRSIHQLRTALDDTAEAPRFVETVPRAGYRFIAPVTSEEVLGGTPPATGMSQMRSYRGFAYALVALLGVALTYFVVDKLFLQQTPASAQRSVAVLPFKNLGNDPGNEVLADGIPDTLLTMLAQIHELRVIGRTSSFSFKGKDVDLRTIGEALGAGAILEGSVQRSGERLRINAQLINASDGVHLWAENFDRTTADVFAIQDEIAKHVADALHITLAGKEGPGSVGTQTFEAYELFLEAAQLIQQRKDAKIPVAIEKLQRALALDRNYPSAWTLLALAHLRDSGPGEAAQQAARRSIELAPEQAGGHFALGTILMYARKDGAAEELARALELAPHRPYPLTGVANEYRQVAGRYADAAALMRRAVNLDPRNFDIRLQAAFSFEANSDLPGALAEVREVIRLQPDMAFAYQTAGEMLYGVLGRMDDAVRFLRRARVLEPDAVHGMHGALITGYALLDEAEQAHRELETIRPLLDVDEFLALRLHIEVLGGHDAAARELLEQALTADPPPRRLLIKADELGIASAQDTAQRVLDRLHAIDTDWIGQAKIMEAYPPICTLAWSGDRDGAAAVLVPWEKRLRRQPTYTFATDDRRTSLARGLACTGRSEEAIVELEKLVAEKYHAGGWRSLVTDHAFDAIRDNSRFQALIAQLRSVAEEERQRFLARPDLDDADIDALTVQR